MDIEIRRLGPEDEHAVHAAAVLFDRTPDRDATRRFLDEPTHHLLIAYDGDAATTQCSGRSRSRSSCCSIETWRDPSRSAYSRIEANGSTAGASSVLNCSSVRCDIDSTSCAQDDIRRGRIWSPAGGVREER